MVLLRPPELSRARGGESPWKLFQVFPKARGCFIPGVQASVFQWDAFPSLPKAQNSLQELLMEPGWCWLLNPSWF